MPLTASVQVAEGARFEIGVLLTLVGSEAEYRLRVSVTSSARLQTALHADPFISGEKPLYRRKALEKGRAAV